MPLAGMVGCGAHLLMLVRNVSTYILPIVKGVHTPGKQYTRTRISTAATRAGGVKWASEVSSDNVDRMMDVTLLRYEMKKKITVLFLSQYERGNACILHFSSLDLLSWWSVHTALGRDTHEISHSLAGVAKWDLPSPILTVDHDFLPALYGECDDLFCLPIDMKKSRRSTFTQPFVHFTHALKELPS